MTTNYTVPNKALVFEKLSKMCTLCSLVLLTYVSGIHMKEFTHVSMIFLRHLVVHPRISAKKMKLLDRTREIEHYSIYAVHTRTNTLISKSGLKIS